MRKELTGQGNEFGRQKAQSTARTVCIQKNAGRDTRRKRNYLVWWAKVQGRGKLREGGGRNIKGEEKKG